MYTKRSDLNSVIVLLQPKSLFAMKFFPYSSLSLSLLCILGLSYQSYLIISEYVEYDVSKKISSNQRANVCHHRYKHVSESMTYSITNHSNWLHSHSMTQTLKFSIESASYHSNSRLSMTYFDTRQPLWK